VRDVRLPVHAHRWHGNRDCLVKAPDEHNKIARHKTISFRANSAEILGLIHFSLLRSYTPMDHEIKPNDPPSNFTSWLMAATDWIDPAELHQRQQDLSCPVLTSQTLAYPSSQYSFVSHGRTRKRKRTHSPTPLTT
jgi:hypothetical protein